MAEAPRTTEIPEDLTLLLRRMQGGDREAGEKAAALVYGELHQIASRELRGEKPGHLLQTTALIHEAYARLIGSEDLEIQNRRHFFAVASRQMRRILVDHARASNSQKRGGGALPVALDGIQAGIDTKTVDLIALDEALEALERVDPRAAQVVELRFFGGYRDGEIAESLGLSVQAIRRDWGFARSWLFDRLHSQPKAARANT